MQFDAIPRKIQKKADTADVRSEKKELAPAAVSRWFCELPVVYIIILMAVMAVFLIFLVLHVIQLSKTTLSRSAVKESIDHLPTGLCFYAANGRILLVNHRMNQLCHVILGRDLQNAALVWDDLFRGNILPDIVPLSMGGQPSFRLPDGTVWSFSRTQLSDMLQITAVDITQLHDLAEELEQKNIALEELYQRLKDYETDVEVLTRTRERLETKIGIHSELGQTLLATRSYLLDSSENKTIPAEAWKHSIALLRQNIVENAEQFTLQTLIQTATAFGISVEVTGQMPEQKAVEKLFLEAATEALTNAVRHADAKTLHILLLPSMLGNMGTNQHMFRLQEQQFLIFLLYLLQKLNNVHFHHQVIFQYQGRQREYIPQDKALKLILYNI